MSNQYNKVIHLLDHMSDDTTVLNSHMINSFDVDYHDHSFYEICYVVNGALSHYINGKRMDLIAGDVIFLRPQDKHAYIRDDGCTSYHRDIIFKSTFFESVLNFLDPTLLKNYHKELLPFKTNLPIEKINDFEKLISEYSLLDGTNSTSKIILAKTILIELLYYYNKPLFQINNNYPLLVNQIIQKLNMRNNLRLGTVYVFANFNYSKSHICNTFKKYTGISLTEYINEQRLNYSTHLLKTTSNSLFDISQECGFSSIPYFINLFKKRFNCTPIKYRHNNQQL